MFGCVGAAFVLNFASLHAALACQGRVNPIYLLLQSMGVMGYWGGGEGGGGKEGGEGRAIGQCSPNESLI